jgi:hypothetical protein
MNLPDRSRNYVVPLAWHVVDVGVVCMLAVLALLFLALLVLQLFAIEV